MELLPCGRRPVTSDVWATMTRKQRKFYEKYKGYPAHLITDSVWDSWTRKIPAPLHANVAKVLVFTLWVLLIGSIIGAFLATPDVSGMYYLFTQTNPTIKATWDGSLPDWIRHLVRDDFIGFFAGLYIAFVTLNRYKPLKPLSRFDRFEMSLKLFGRHLMGNLKDDVPLQWQQWVLGIIIFCPLYATVGFGFGIFITDVVGSWGWVQHLEDHLFGWLLPALKQHASPHGIAMIDRIHDSIVDKVPGKLTGLLMAYCFGRRPLKGPMSDAQLHICQRLLQHQERTGSLGLRRFVLWLPNWRATFNDVRAQGVEVIGKVSAWSVLRGRGVLLLGLALAGYGWYVLLYIVHKH